jgi:hypothetical protein
MAFFTNFAIGLLFFAACGVACAQYCPPGQHPVVGQGFSYCVVDPSSGGDTDEPPQPEPKWSDRYGAVVTDGKAGVIGSSSGARTQPEAEAMARNDCKAKGGSNCALNVIYGNKCVALVTGDHLFNLKLGKTVDEAKDAAMAGCHDANCRVFFTDCSPPIRIQ